MRGAAVRVACVALAACALMLPAATAAPTEVHLSLGDPDALAGYTLAWVETDPSAPALVTLRTSEGDVSIQGERVLGPSPGLVHWARLPPLEPGLRYAYDIDGRAFELRAPASNASFTFVALGDMGTTREAGAAVATIQDVAPDMVLHLGDISYAGGDPTIWQRWFEMVEPVAAAIPWVPALGNHEGDVLGAATDEAAVVDPHEQAIFRQRFPLPADTFYYSFDAGGIHFVALDTFSQVTMPPEEVAWLAADLAAAQDADWIVAFLHEPPYSSNAAHGSSPRAHGAFAQALEAAGVDLVLTGHDHSYERSFALRGGEVASSSNVTAKGAGTIYVVTGGGGAELYTSFLEPQPEWSAAREAVHHVLLVNATRERLDARVLATDGSGFTDSFSIVRDAAAGEPPVAPSDVPASGAALAVLSLAVFALIRRR